MKKVAVLLLSLFVVASSLLTNGTPARASNDTVTINASDTIGMTSPMLFGGVFYPNRNHLTQLGPMITEIGLKWIRVPIRPESILPENITLNDYINNVNNVQDPSTWDWSWGYAIGDAKSRGMKVFGTIAFGGPAWLTYSGTTEGVPKDWDVYEDIITKIYTHYQNQLDYVGITNEPHWFVDLIGSPYSSADEAAKDINYHGISAIRSVSSTVKIIVADDDIGAPDFGSLTEILGDTRLADSDINALSLHDYSYGNINELGALKVFAANYGRTPTEYLMTEWNHSLGQDDQVTSEEGISFHGKRFINYIRQGWTGAALYALNALDILLDDYTQEWNVHGMYNWNNGSPELLPWTRTWRVLSNKLGWGAGNGTAVRATTMSGVTDAIGVINSNNRMTAALVNDSNTSLTIDVNIDNVSYASAPAVSVYTASSSNNGSTASTVSSTYANNRVSFTVTVPAYSTVGISLSGSVSVVPSDGANIYYLNGSSWTQMPGYANRIAIDTGGAAWVVNSSGDLFQWNGSGWNTMRTGDTQDVGTGANGTVAIALEDSTAWGGDVLIWNGSSWTNTGGQGQRVAVDSSGAVWVVNAGGDLWKYNGSWTQMRWADTYDVGAGPSGVVAVTLQDGSYGGSIYKYNGSAWTAVGGEGQSIAVDYQGNLWTVNAGGYVWYHNGSSWSLKKSGGGADVGSSPAFSATWATSWPE